MSVFLVISLLLVIVYLVYLLVHKKFDYWEKRNVPFLKPLPLLGNYGRYIVFQEYPGHVVKKLCQKFRNKPYFGAFYGTEPVLVVQSPELLKLVFTKDFYYFHGREITKYENRETTTRNIFFSSGDNWKVFRQNLSPLFTSSKMKSMFYLIEKCSHVLEDILNSETNISEIIEARQLSCRFTMDCICTCVFGIEANTMVDPVNNPLQYMSEEIFKSSYLRGFKIIFRAVWPAIFYGMGLEIFPPTIDNFFSNMLKGVIESRNHKPSSKHDFVDMVLSLKQNETIACDSIHNLKTGLNEKIHKTLGEKEILSQCTLFFGAGFETSASTLSFTLYELAKHPAVQKRAAEEVDEYMRRHGNKLNYECTTELPYLEACLYETLRKYPVISVLTREVMDDYVLPDGVRLDKGVRVHIPVYSLHHNPDYFPEPALYKPERFLSENLANIKQYTFLPYGEGPRICMGKRFSKMQYKAGLVTFLKKYRFELAEGMTKEVPLVATTILTQPRDTGLMLKISKREGWEQRMFVKT